MKKEPIKILAAIVVLTAALGGSYYVGFQDGLDQTKNITIEHLINTDTPEEVKTDFNLFWEAWDKLKTEHIKGEEITDEDLLYGAISGLAKAFGDPNTVFFTPDDSQKFNEDVRGNFSGIGAEIGIKDGQLVVVSPLKDSPAEKAGLLPGDQILQIDGKSTSDLGVEDAVKLIRGELGTTVTLTILREGWDSSQNFEITRANIQVPTVEWEMVEGNIIHLQLFSFTRNTALDLQRATLAALLEGGDGLILDLRGNPGGLLDSAVSVAGFFIERGEIVVTEKFTSDEDNEVLRSFGNGALRNFPVVVLIDGGSASASEILAGAMRVQNSTLLIGEKSFGKGTVQQIESLSNDSTLKITIANWLLPDGTLIEGNGLEPDYPVEITDEDIAAGRDPQLEKAIEVLRTQM